MEVTPTKSSPYASSSRQDLNQHAVGEIVESFVDLIVHSILRIKPKPLKFAVDRDLLETYSSKLDQLWAKVEQLRDEAVAQRRRYLSVGGLAILASILLQAITGYGLFPLILSVIITVVYAVRPSVVFKQAFTREVMPKLLRQLPNYTYQSDGFISISEIESSGIIPAHDTTFTRQEDYFSARFGDNHFEVVECELSRKRYRNNRSEKSAVFAGLICRLTLNTEATHRVILHANWGALMSWLQKKPMSDAHCVKLPYNTLGNRYDIYGDNETYLKAIVTKEVLDKIKRLLNKLDVAAPEFSLVGKQLVILLHRPKDFLKAPHFAQLSNRSALVESILKDTLLIDELRLISEAIAANVNEAGAIPSHKS